MKTRANLNNFLVMSVFLLATLCTAATGGTIYVDDDALGPTHDGTSWANAYNYLQDALTGASSGDEIWVAQGTYKPDEDNSNPTGTGDRNATFQLISGVAMYGGFLGDETSLDQRDWQAHETILSGDLNGDDGPDFANNGENSYHVVKGSGTNNTAILDGFSITAGNANAPYSLQYFGGGMWNVSGSPTVANCTFIRNSTPYFGGGMCNWDDSSPTVMNCTFSGNSANSGGGMANGRSSPTVTNCTFSGNNSAGSRGNGGGMENRNYSSPTLTNCTFSGNSAVNGGGMYNETSSPTLTNCTFSGNGGTANARGGGMHNSSSSSPTVTDCTFSENYGSTGGGMHNYDGSPTVTNCTFSGNSAVNSGGGMHNRCASPSLTNCTFSGNNSSGFGSQGGGMANNVSSSPTLTNCTFSENLAKYGGGMWNGASSPTVTNCTFSGNSAVYKGGGMHNRSSSPMLTNCIFSENSAKDGGGMHNYYSEPTVANCTFSGNRADEAGGGMYNYGGSPTVTNCKFTRNSADVDGGGMYNTGLWHIHDPVSPCNPTLTNCTFSGNSASYLGGGMYNNTYSSPTLTNCILWGNTTTNGAGAQIALRSKAYPSTLTISYSDVQGGAEGVYVETYCTLNWGTGNIALDPLFADADLRLSAGSPCINVGSNAALPPDTADLDGDGDTTEPIPLDLDGNARIFNGIVDMGAYEGEGQGPSVITVEIDIKPGSYPSSINLRSKGVTPVAIHTTDDFDATTVDPSTVQLNLLIAPLMWEIYDCDELPNPLYGDPLFPDEPEVIGDGDIDLVLYFETQELVATGAVEVGDEWAILTGATFGGTLIEGMGDVNIVVKKDKP